MPKINLVVSGDGHLDLKTEGIDRTNDIINAKMQSIDYAIGLKEKNKFVAYLDMGDVFHGTRPRSEVTAAAIKMYRKLQNHQIETVIIAGNHDVIDQKDKTSALAPIEAAGFSYISIYHDIELVSLYQGLNLVLLPHISKARAIAAGHKNVQDYIDSMSEAIENMLSEYQMNIVLGHLNIAGAKTGTESYMIKGAHEDFPQVLKKSKKVNYIFNGHIHRPQTIENLEGAPIIITGDSQCNDFGERLDTKVFFHLEVEV